MLRPGFNQSQLYMGAWAQNKVVDTIAKYAPGNAKDLRNAVHMLQLKGRFIHLRKVRQNSFSIQAKNP